VESVIISLVRLVHIVNLDNCKVAIITEITKGETSSGLDTQFLNLLLRDLEGNGYAEEVAI